MIELRSQILGTGNGPRLLITGGVHGDELEPVFALRALVERPELRGLRGTLTVVPIVNEAAFARKSRVAEDRLDLARVCPGKADGSITQQAAHALSELIRAADYYIDLHTGGAALRVWPLTGYALHPNPAVLEKQRAMARAFNLPVIWGTDPKLEGRSLSVARDARVPAIYAEYLGGGDCSAEGTAAYIEGCLNVLAALSMIDRPQPTSRIEHVVEDPRPGTGHMQRSYPARANGLFEPAVELGQRVAAGQALGHVRGGSAASEQTVIAEEAGLVIVLRVTRSVSAGENLAVILPLREAG